jgi:hypothetical protein
MLVLLNPASTNRIADFGTTKNGWPAARRQSVRAGEHDRRPVVHIGIVVDLRCHTGGAWIEGCCCHNCDFRSEYHTGSILVLIAPADRAGVSKARLVGRVSCRDGVPIDALLTISAEPDTVSTVSTTILNSNELCFRPHAADSHPSWPSGCGTRRIPRR